MKTLNVRLKKGGRVLNPNGKPITSNPELVPDNRMYRHFVKDGSLEVAARVEDPVKSTIKKKEAPKDE